MSRLRRALSLLVLAVLSVGSVMAASPRDTPEYYASPPPETAEERRSRQAGEMGELLGQLVGKFGLERPWVFSQPPPSPNAARTMWDCIAIGEGKGVHCVVLTVPPRAVPAGRTGAGTKQQVPAMPPRPGRPAMASSFAEYGLDPNASRVRLMKVDRGSAIRMEGRVGSNTLTIWGRCWNSTPDCEKEQRITVLEDGKDLWIRDYTNWEPPPVNPRYRLRRLTQEEVDAANWSVEGARPKFPTKPSRPR